MTPPTLRQVLSRLHEENLGPSIAELEAVLPENLTGMAGMAEPTPWFIRVLVGLGAWTASWMFLGFLALIGVLRTESMAILVGLGLHIAALFLRKNGGDFYKQLALSANLLGQGLFIGGITFSLQHEVHVGAILTMLVSAYMIWIYPDRTQRFLSGLCFGVAWHVLFSPLARMRDFVHDYDSATGLVSILSDLSLVSLAAFTGAVLLARPRSAAVERAAGPVGYGLLIALLHLLASATGGQLFREHAAVYTGSLCAIGIGICVIGLMLWLLREKNIAETAPDALAAIAGTILVLLFTRNAPGVITAMAVLLIGFRLRSRVLIGLAILFECLFLSGFYYTLSVTLLQKSIVLLGTGLLLIGMRFYVVLRPTAEAK